MRDEGDSDTDAAGGIDALDPERAPGCTIGQRRYGRSDLEWIAGVIMLREAGMGVGGIREIAALSRTPGTEVERLAFFEAHRRQVQRELARTRRYLAAIEQKIAAYRAVVEKEES